MQVGHYVQKSVIYEYHSFSVIDHSNEDFTYCKMHNSIQMIKWKIRKLHRNKSYSRYGKWGNGKMEYKKAMPDIYAILKRFPSWQISRQI